MEQRILEKKYPDLPGSKPVERAVRKARQEGEQVIDTKEDRVRAYLRRLNRIVDSERGWDMLKKKLISEYTIDVSDPAVLLRVSHDLAICEERPSLQVLASDVVFSEASLEQLRQRVYEKRDLQESSLLEWLEYVRANRAEYPHWFRYLVVRNLQKMGALNPERDGYLSRTGTTSEAFPDLNPEALSFVYRAFVVGVGAFEYDQQSEKRQELERLIVTRNFPKLYAFAQQEVRGALNRETSIGEWVAYKQGSDYRILETALSGKNTNWCTAKDAAPSELREGSIYVYFTRGSEGAFSEPRIAIRIDGQRVAEVRGVNAHQEVEPELVAIAEAKCRILPHGEKFLKIADNIRRVDALAASHGQGVPFTIDDLRFLYEVDGPIDGFGYQKDPRLKELRAGRNVKEDLSAILELPVERISITQEEGLSGFTRFHYGSLDASSLTSSEHLMLPETVTGSLRLDSLASAHGLKLPRVVGGDLNLGALRSAVDMILPESVGGNLNLCLLRDVGELTLPKFVGSSADLSSLESVDGIILPESVGGMLYLRKLTSMNPLRAPQWVGRYMDVGKLAMSDREALRRARPDLRLLW